MISLFPSDHVRRFDCIWGETKEAPHIKIVWLSSMNTQKGLKHDCTAQSTSRALQRFSVPLISKHGKMNHYFVRNISFLVYQIQYAINLHPFSVDIALIEEFRKAFRLL